MPETVSTEIWKTIEEFPDYAVSSFGNVKRIIPDKCNRPMRVLKPDLRKTGYRMVTLFGHGMRKCHKVARLVAAAFLQLDPVRNQVNHKNGNKADDRASNLEWTTCSENITHAYHVLGRIGPRGEIQGQAKLTASDVLQIRAMRVAGVMQKTVAALFNVTPGNIYLIERKKNWKHV